ncbi:MAG TPA: multicopper oxidase domain-containing protein [Thermoanaerobaculia bacterium]|nr:multicopper oxidase domain-containing protein [Thermoanaerobaculia bacterium]
MLTALAELNDGPCEPGQPYVQRRLSEPVTIGPRADGTLQTELVVRIRERCVPVWVQPETPEGGETPEPRWEMQTLRLRTYGFPKDPDRPITAADADDPDSPHIAWSAPGPNFLVHPASAPGAPDGTRFLMRLYNRMPHDGEPHACDPSLKCNTKGPDAGVDPLTGECKVPPDPAQGGVPEFVPSQVVDGKVIEPPNCFHGNNSTNFHFHGFHISPQLGQDFVGLELRPPVPADVHHASMPAHGTHGESGVVAYGQFDFAVDPLRYTQPPGTHWYHAHKHGSTALQVLNGLVGTFEVRGEFDAALDDYFATAGGGPLVDRLMVVQQLQERQPGLGGADQNASVLINGQANPIVTMKRGEIQRWRFVGATMQASAALRVGFPEVAGKGSPEVRQIAMDGVQFSPENYVCQPFLNAPDCSPAADDSEFDELTAFQLSPGNRVDLLVKAPLEAGTHCMVYDITTELHETAEEEIRGALEERAEVSAGTCGIDPNTNLGPLFTLVVEPDTREMAYPSPEQFPPMASYLADIPPVTDPALQRDIHYEMVNQGNLNGTQFWINQQKYSADCANDTLILDQPQQWTLWNNSDKIAHPFHIHQNPFQLVAESGRTPNEYRYPVWRDTMPIPTAAAAVAPNSNPVTSQWGNARIRYVAKEFTGLFVNHCHILGHEDRGMMQNTQASCPDGSWATTGPVAPGAECDAEGFCPSDCVTGEPIPATPACPAPPPQDSDWPAAYGVTG